MLTKFLTVAALAIASVSAVSPTVTRRTVSLNPSPDTLVESYHPIPQVLARQLTNGRRLRDGLKLKPPMRRSKVARDAAPSSLPATTTQGYVMLKNADTGSSLGYLANTFNTFGEYGATTQTLGAALKLEFTATADAFSITTLNGPDADYPFLGGINGFANSGSNLGSGSSNYIYIGGTGETATGSTPVNGGNTFTKAANIAETIESAIWKYADGEITAQWTNTDGSAPATYIGILGDVLLVTGDKAAFVATFGATTWVTIEYVPV